MRDWKTLSSAFSETVLTASPAAVDTIFHETGYKLEEVPTAITKIEELLMNQGQH
jgi:hypothetical protein